jgi:hypothetical protein
MKVTRGADRHCLDFAAILRGRGTRGQSTLAIECARGPQPRNGLLDPFTEGDRQVWDQGPHRFGLVEHFGGQVTEPEAGERRFTLANPMKQITTAATARRIPVGKVLTVGPPFAPEFTSPRHTPIGL